MADRANALRELHAVADLMVRDDRHKAIEDWCSRWLESLGNRRVFDEYEWKILPARFRGASKGADLEAFGMALAKVCAHRRVKRSALERAVAIETVAVVVRSRPRRTVGGTRNG